MIDGCSDDTFQNAQRTIRDIISCELRLDDSRHLTADV